MEQNMSYYDYCKQVIASEVPMEPETFAEKLNEIVEYIAKGTFFMLLCRERNDYTVFFNTNGDAEVIDRDSISQTILNRGSVLVIDKQPNDMYEIWIRDFETNENFVYYLFNYEFGMVEV